MNSSTITTRRPFTVCIEGNIGSGKTTFLRNFQHCPNMVALPEPVELWRNVSGTNLLECMYRDPKRYAFLFQSYVQLTMLRRQIEATEMPIKIMERSVYSARCFVENMRRSKLIPKLETDILFDWYSWSEESDQLKTDLIVYLRSDPKIVHARVAQRARKEEDCVSIEYLQQIHEIHEEWLFKKTLFSVPAPVMTLDANVTEEEMLRQFYDCRRIIFEKAGQQFTE